MAKGIFIPDITVEMIRKAPLEAIETLLVEGEMYDVDIPKWIPCSEKLPNEDEEVLVTSNSGIFFIAELSKTRDKTIYWFETIEGKSLRNVTAWMPLPEPYGGDGE